MTNSKSKGRKPYFPKGNNKPNPKGKGKQKSVKEEIEDNFNNNGTGTKLDKKSLEKASNNPKLYQRFPELLRWASNIPINVISNLPAPLGDNSLTLPNIVIFGISLISPCTANSSDERNTNMIQLSNDLYARIRQDNAGAKNYDPPALTRLIFAMAGVFQRINFLQRIYGLINHTSVYNRAFPQMLFRAMHLDYESFRDDQVNFAGRLDTIIVRAKDIRLVADVPILERIGMMYANYYIDTSDLRDTLYIPCPGKNGFLDMDATENLIFSDGPQNLSVGVNQAYTDADDKLVTADDLLKDTEQYLNKVLTSQDFGIMQGDIVHAFPGASLTTLNALPDKLDLPPIDDKAMLLQYHNADVGGTYWKTNNNFFLNFDNKGLPIGNYELPNSTLNPHHMFVDYPTTKPTGSIPAVISNNRFYKDYSFMCLDSDTTDPDWYVEVTRMKAEAGVDIISNVIVLKAIDTKVMSDIMGTFTYSPTNDDVTFTYGAFPYNKYVLDYKAQRSCRLIPIADVTNQSLFKSYGLNNTFKFDYRSVQTAADAINQETQVWDRLRAICRYLPYGITNFRYYKDSSSASTPITVTDHGTYEPNTFCPIVQPVPESTMRMLSFICWKSLLSFPR